MDIPLNRVLTLAGCYGLQSAPKFPEFSHIPLSLTPCELQTESFNELITNTPNFSALMFNISKTPEYLYSVLKEVCVLDEFTNNLVELSKKAKLEGAVQNVSLGISRNDFMFDIEENRFLQVEFNTISASFVHLSSKIAEFHRHLQGLKKKVVDVVPNPATVKCVDAFELAHKLYGNKGCILFVVLPNETNLVDQTGIELELWKRGVTVVRASLEEVGLEGVINEDKCLVFRDSEISIVYFRAGYMPEQYPTSLSWQGREKIELSKAIKCPNIDYHLAGCKKIQQALNTDMHLFTNTPECLLKNTTEIYDFSKISQKIVETVQSNPKDWVLKPQREGGGNNIYGQDILPKLANHDQHPEYILMKMIKCQEKECVMLKNGTTNRVLALSEVGMFGALVANGSEIVMNEYVGYLVRTKSRDSNEGGIAAGFGVLDCIRLI